jgi:hypothetical protein
LLFEFSIPINLKVLDFLIKNNNEDILGEFILINNNMKYLSDVLFKAGFNVIYFGNPTAYECYYVGINYELPVNIFNFNINKSNLMILTNRKSVYYDDNFFKEF